MTTPTSGQTPPLMASHDEIRKALGFFKIMAFIVGVGLLVLVVEMVLKYGLHTADKDNPLAWWPQPHGFLFMLYALAAFYLGLKVRWGVPKLVGVMLAGCVPFLSFVIERKVAREVGAILAGPSRSARVGA